MSQNAQRPPGEKKLRWDLLVWAPRALVGLAAREAMSKGGIQQRYTEKQANLHPL